MVYYRCVLCKLSELNGLTTLLIDIVAMTGLLLNFKEIRKYKVAVCSVLLVDHVSSFSRCHSIP